MKELLINIAGILSFLNLAWYALKVWRNKAKPNSTASWLMWVALDGSILACTIATHKPFALPLSYTTGAFLVLIVHFKLGTWVWTNVETWSAVGATITFIIWQTMDARFGVISGVVAMTLAGIPIMRHMWRHPDPEAFWMFGNTVIACVMTLVGTWPWTIGGSLLSAGGIAFNGMMAWMVLRDRPALESD